MGQMQGTPVFADDSGLRVALAQYTGRGACLVVVLLAGVLAMILNTHVPLPGLDRLAAVHSGSGHQMLARDQSRAGAVRARGPAEPLRRMQSAPSASLSVPAASLRVPAATLRVPAASLRVPAASRVRVLRRATAVPVVRRLRTPSLSRAPIRTLRTGGAVAVARRRSVAQSTTLGRAATAPSVGTDHVQTPAARSTTGYTAPATTSRPAVRAVGRAGAQQAGKSRNPRAATPGNPHAQGAKGSSRAAIATAHRKGRPTGHTPPTARAPKFQGAAHR